MSLRKKPAALFASAVLVFIFIMAAGCIGSAPSGGVAQNVTATEQGSGGIQSGSNTWSTGIISNWKPISITLAIIGVMIAAIAIMFGEPLNMPELKAWAKVELSQALITVIIVLFAVAALSFIDEMVSQQVNNSPGSPVHCNSGDACLLKVSNSYIDGLINLSNEDAKSAFRASLDAGMSSSKRITVSCGVLIPCAWGYISWANNGFLLLDVERYNYEIEQHANIIYSLALQKFFMNNVAYLAGPGLLLIGIVGRSIFLTRRIGGTLIAVALAIMVVFPLMYLWNLITLNVTIFGDALFNVGSADCPAACGVRAPTIVKGSASGNGYDYEELVLTRSTEDIENLESGNISSIGDAYSCEYIALSINSSNSAYNSPDNQYYCPYGCRELPYPYGALECAKEKVQLACMQMPAGCKVMRNVTALGTLPSDCSLANCSDACKVIPPLNGGTGCSACYDSADPANPVALPFNCRVALGKTIVDPDNTTHYDYSERPEQCQWESTDPQYPNPFKNLVNSCPADYNALNSCSYIVPDIPDCECTGPSCCINAHGSDIPECFEYLVINASTRTVNNKDDDGDHYAQAEGDNNATVFFNCNESSSSQPCLNYTGAKFWNNNTVTCTCNGRNCSMPSTSCEKCLDQNEYCMFKPAIVADCSTSCADLSLSKPALLSSSEFAKRSSDGMVGREDIKNVSRLYLPAFLLPLINIAVSIMFIRGLSPLFGGDVEIPGFAKVL
jgi:hypothetical protein